MRPIFFHNDDHGLRYQLQALTNTQDLHLQAYGPLTNIIRKIQTIDDPYYMNLSPETYRAVTKD